MNTNQEALELIKKFVAGASCATIDLSPDGIKLKMFWHPCEKIATDMGFSEINSIVFKKYMFEVHNEMVLDIFKAGGCNFKEAVDCMVRAIKIEDQKLACIHGGVVVCSMTAQEYEELVYRNMELLRPLVQGVR